MEMSIREQIRKNQEEYYQSIKDEYLRNKAKMKLPGKEQKKEKPPGERYVPDEIPKSRKEKKANSIWR